MIDPTHIADVINVQGDTITAVVRQEAAPGLTFSKGHAYYVGQVGAYVRIPLGLVDLFAIVVQVGSNAGNEHADDGPVPGRPWLRLELLGEAHRDGSFVRGVARYPSIGDRVQLVTATDLSRLYRVDDEARNLRLGHIANAPHLPALVDVSRMVTRHVAVVGSTGSGKSTTAAAIISAMTSPARFPSARVLVLDVHGEYGGAFGDAATRLKVDANDTSTTAGEQLCLPFWALPFDDFADLAFGGLDDNSATIVQQLVADRKRAYALRHPELGVDSRSVTSDTPLPFSVRSLWLELHEMQFAIHSVNASGQSPATRMYAKDAAGDEMRGDPESLIAPTYAPQVAQKTFMSGATVNARRQTNSLGAKLRDPRYDFLFRPGPWDVDASGEVERTLGAFLEAWLGGVKSIVTADLSGVPNQILQRIVSVLLRLLYESLVWARMLAEGGRSRPILIVLEEAHRYLADTRDAASEIVERIVKEGRKFGVGLMIVSQRPSEIQPTVLSQVGSFVVLRLSNSADRSLIRSSLPDNLSGLFDAVPVLRTGEAIISGEAVKLPTRVVVDAPVSSRPDSSDPEVISSGLPGGWDAPRPPQDYEDVASTWMNLTPSSQRVINSKGSKGSR
jgi:hypothetical protein